MNIQLQNNSSLSTPALGTLRGFSNQVPHHGMAVLCPCKVLVLFITKTYIKHVPRSHLNCQNSHPAPTARALCPIPVPVSLILSHEQVQLFSAAANKASATLPEQVPLFAPRSRAQSAISAYSKAHFELHSVLTHVVQWYIAQCCLYKGKNHCSCFHLFNVLTSMPISGTKEPAARSRAMLHVFS